MKFSEELLAVIRNCSKLMRCLVVLLVLPDIALADVSYSGMAARFEVETSRDGSRIIHLLAGGPLGLGGIAAGTISSAETGPTIWLAGVEEVSGVEPTPFFPVGEGDVSGIDPTPFAPDGRRVLSFNFDPAGDFSGIQPTPFRVFVATPRRIVGEVLFDNVSAATGSLVLSGLQLQTDGGLEDLPPVTLLALQENSSAVAVPMLPTGAAAVGTLGLLIVAADRRRRRRNTSAG